MESHSHKHSLPEAVMNTIKPTFRFLAHPDLLKKCTHGKTQNPNESYNQLIWKRCPKTTFASSNVVKIAAYDACIVFNDGNIGRIKTLQRIGFNAGAFTLSILKIIDDQRIALSELSADFFTKESRQRNQTKTKATQDEEEEEDYGYGLH